MIFSHWFPEPVVSPPDEALPLLVPAPEISKGGLEYVLSPPLGGRKHLKGGGSLYETRFREGEGPRPSISDQAPNERGDGAVPPPLEISPSHLPRIPSGLGGPGRPFTFFRAARRYFPKHLKPEPQWQSRRKRFLE